MDVRCENFRTDEKGGLRGFCDLVIEPLGVRLYSCKLFRSGSREWIEFPSRQYQSKGETKYVRTVDFTTRSGYQSFSIRSARSDSEIPFSAAAAGRAARARCC